MSDFEYTISLITKEAETLYRLTRDPEPGLASWCLMVGESMARLEQYKKVQAQPLSSVAN